MVIRNLQIVSFVKLILHQQNQQKDGFNLISSEDGQDTPAWQIWAQSLTVFSRKYPTPCGKTGGRTTRQRIWRRRLNSKMLWKEINARHCKFIFRWYIRVSRSTRVGVYTCSPRFFFYLFGCLRDKILHSVSTCTRRPSEPAAVWPKYV